MPRWVATCCVCLVRRCWRMQALLSAQGHTCSLPAHVPADMATSGSAVTVQSCSVTDNNPLPCRCVDLCPAALCCGDSGRLAYTRTSTSTTCSGDAAAWPGAQPCLMVARNRGSCRCSRQPSLNATALPVSGADTRVMPPPTINMQAPQRAQAQGALHDDPSPARLEACRRPRRGWAGRPLQQPAATTQPAAAAGAVVDPSVCVAAAARWPSMEQSAILIRPPQEGLGI